MEQLDNILGQATAAIGPKFFLLPTHRGPAVYRERVYCYELYHQLRRYWPLDCRYSLGGEIDKGGHAYFRGEGEKRKTPDLLIHVPGTGDNYAVIEVKSCRARRPGIAKDLATLKQFTEPAIGYLRAIYLIYGGGTDSTVAKVKRCATDISSSPFELWLHQRPSEQAFRPVS